MSYIQYIASDRPLPEGNFGNEPLYIFDSLTHFAHSDIYPIYLKNHLESEAASEKEWQERFGRPAPKAAPRDEFLEKHREFRGRAVVWSKDHPMKGARVDSFEEWNFSGDKWVRRADLRKKLSKPYIYFVDGDFLDYLCWALRPGEVVEYLCCWNGEEREPLCVPDRHVDLEDYVQNGGLPREPLDGNHRVFYHAPKEPQPWDCTTKWGNLKYLWLVNLDYGSICSVLFEYHQEEKRLREQQS